jgi:hypothetical protein
MMLSRLATFRVALLLSTSFGCAFSSTPSEEASSNEAAAMTKPFKLYEDLERAGGRCDVYTVLTLGSRATGELKDVLERGTVLYAHLHNEASGDCGLRLDPDPRDYALLFDGEECGTRVYKASETREGLAREMTLTDNRGRVCTDYDAAPKLVVEETSRSGDIHRLSSFDGARLRPVS